MDPRLRGSARRLCRAAVGGGGPAVRSRDRRPRPARSSDAAADRRLPPLPGGAAAGRLERPYHPRDEMTPNLPSTPPAGAARRARIAIAGVFLVNGAAIGSWVPHIPDVQSALDLSTGVLGLALLAVAAGSLIGLPAAGALVGRFGSPIVVRIAAPAGL